MSNPQTRRMRRRREVHPAMLSLASIAFRYSISRDAWVLRGIGNRYGPVLKRRRGTRRKPVPSRLDTA